MNNFKDFNDGKETIFSRSLLSDKNDSNAMQPKWQFDYYFWLEEVFFFVALIYFMPTGLKGKFGFYSFSGWAFTTFPWTFLSHRTEGADDFLWRQIHSIEIVTLIWPFQFHPRAPIEAFDKVFKSTKEKCFAILFLRILQSLSESPRSRQSIPWVGFSAPTQTTFPPPSNYITAPWLETEASLHPPHHHHQPPKSSHSHDYQFLNN